MEKSIAKDLLAIGAVFLRPEEPFTWASGNSGFALTGLGKDGPSSFPTFQRNDGKDGKALCLVTRKTGTFGTRLTNHLLLVTYILGYLNLALR